jgi:hypothetical protein
MVDGLQLPFALHFFIADCLSADVQSLPSGGGRHSLTESHYPIGGRYYHSM